MPPFFRERAFLLAWEIRHSAVHIGQLIGHADNTGLSSGDHNHTAGKPVEYFQNSTITYNIFQDNGYYGAVDISPFWTGKYAEDYDEFNWKFQYDLQLGDEGEEVRQLQTALQILGYFPKAQPLTMFYGPVTRKAVQKFQDIYGIVAPLTILGYGRFGPKSRYKMNQLFQPA